MSKRLRFVSRGVRLALVTGIVSAVLALDSGTPAQAGPLAVVEGETLDVQAQKLDIDVEKGTAILEGNVTAKLGELEVVCPKVDIRYDKAPRVEWARGSGGVRAKVKGIDARASVVVVDVARRVVRLSGAVRLTRGRGWVKAGRASIDLNTHKVTLHDVKGSIPVEPPAR